MLNFLVIKLEIALIQTEHNHRLASRLYYWPDEDEANLPGDLYAST